MDICINPNLSPFFSINPKKVLYYNRSSPRSHYSEEKLYHIPPLYKCKTKNPSFCLINDHRKHVRDHFKNRSNYSKQYLFILQFSENLVSACTF